MRCINFPCSCLFYALTTIVLDTFEKFRLGLSCWICSSFFESLSSLGLWSFGVSIQVPRFGVWTLGSVNECHRKFGVWRGFLWVDCCGYYMLIYLFHPKRDMLTISWEWHHNLQISKAPLESLAYIGHQINSRVRGIVQAYRGSPEGGSSMVARDQAGQSNC